MILPQFNRIMKRISMRKSDEKSGPPFETALNFIYSNRNRIGSVEERNSNTICRSGIRYGKYNRSMDPEISPEWWR